MSGQKKGKKIFPFKQRITPDFKIDNSTPINPPTHTKENLITVQGGSYQPNARQNIVTKTDVNSY